MLAGVNFKTIFYLCIDTFLAMLIAESNPQRVFGDWHFLLAVLIAETNSTHFCGVCHMDISSSQRLTFNHVFSTGGVGYFQSVCRAY